MEMGDEQGLSIVIPVTERCDDLKELFHSYRQALEPAGRVLQFIFVARKVFSSSGASYELRENIQEFKGKVIVK